MSAFLAYSNTKRAVLKKKNPSLTNGDISKLLSKAWKEEPEEERQKFISKARNLHDEYIIQRDFWRRRTEKIRKREARKAKANKLLGVVGDSSEFGGLDGTGGYRSHEQHPDAPKRPMSAFLAYSNSKRAALKRNNPSLKNGDLSKILSKAWKGEPEDVRQTYIQEARTRRSEFKAGMAAFHKEFDMKKREAIKKRKVEQQRAQAASKKARRAEEQQQHQEEQKPRDDVGSDIQQNTVDCAVVGNPAAATVATPGLLSLPDQANMAAAQSAVGLVQGGNANIMGMVPVLNQGTGLQQVILGQAGLQIQLPQFSMGALPAGAPSMQIHSLVANQATAGIPISTALQAQMFQPFTMGAGAASAFGGLQAGAALNNAASLQGAQLLLNSLNQRLGVSASQDASGTAIVALPNNNDGNNNFQDMNNHNNMNLQNDDSNFSSI